MSNYTHIHPDFHHIMALSDDERLEFLDHPRWVGYERAAHLLNIMQPLPPNIFAKENWRKQTWILKSSFFFLF